MSIVPKHNILQIDNVQYAGRISGHGPWMFVYANVLRATDRKYQKSHDKQEISDFTLFHLNVPFGELFSKITIKSSTALSFF